MRKNINLYYCGFFFILSLIFLGALDPILTCVSFVLTIVIATILGKYYRNKSSADACIGIVYLLVFQNFCIGLGAHLTGNSNDSLKFLTQIPFLSIAIIWICIQNNPIRGAKIVFEKTQKYFFLLLACIFIAIIIGRGNIQSILVNLRNLTVFYMAFEIGKHNLNNEQKMKEFIERFLKIAKLVLYVGIIIMILGYNAYQLIGIREVYIAKGAPITSEGLDSRFYTTLISKQYMRMGSLYYEPVNLAYFFALAFIISIFCRKGANRINKIVTILLMGTGLLLTFGKGGYLIVGAVCLCLFIQKIFEILFNRFSKKKIYIATIITIIIILTAFCIFYYKNIGAAVSPHFWGVMRTWKSVLMKPYGYGLGTGGNGAQIFNSNPGSWLDTGGETALMSYMYQIGIQGVIVLTICMYQISINTQYKNMNVLYKVFSYLPIILLGISLLQDNTFSPQCIVPFMLLQGAAKVNVQRYKEN